MEVGQRIAFHRIFQLLCVKMRIYFGGGNAFMAQQLLQCADIHMTVPIHQCRGRVPELMG